MLDVLHYISTLNRTPCPVDISGGLSLSCFAGEYFCYASTLNIRGLLKVLEFSDNIILLDDGIYQQLCSLMSIFSFFLVFFRKVFSNFYNFIVSRVLHSNVIWAHQCSCYITYKSDILAKWIQVTNEPKKHH